MYRDVVASARALGRTPTWTALLILTIGLGIAGNVSVDGFVRGLLSQASAAGDADAAAGASRIGGLLRWSAIAVFAIACANVASFLLARASARVRETAVRVAIGAGRRQLARQVAADSVVIAVAGAAAGALLAFWIAQLVPALLFDEDAQKMIFAPSAIGVLMITMLCTAITIACGLLPLVETRDDPGAIIQRESSGPSRASIRLGGALVVIQVAACTLLVVSTGLLFSGFQSAVQTSAGRRLSHPIVVSMEALQTSSKSVERSSGLQYFDGAIRAIREVTSASSIALAAAVPGNRPSLQTFEFETPDAPRRELSFLATPFTERTLEMLIMPPAAGRLFGTQDAGPCAGVVLTVEAAAMLLGRQVLNLSEVRAQAQVTTKQLGQTTQIAKNQHQALTVGRSIETPVGWADIVGVVDVRGEDVPRVFHYTPGDDAAVAPPAMTLYRSPELTSRTTELDVNVVSPNYFQFMGFPIVGGRGFDDTIDPCRVAIVNQEAADRYFDGHAVGGAIIDRLGRRTSIIGIAGVAKLRAAGRAVPPTVFFPMEQDFLFHMTLIAETPGTNDVALERLHRRLALIPGGREDKIIVTTLDRHLSRTAFASERIATVLVGASAAIALALGMFGLYGSMSEAARRRQREFALRIALGAREGHVVGQVLSEGLRLVVAGTMAGLLGSILVAQSISRITPTDEPLSPWIWIAAPLMLVIAVVIASVLPARRALASDPLMIMKDNI